MKSKKNVDFIKNVIVLISTQCFIKIFGLVYSLYLINKKEFGDTGNAVFLSGYQIFIFLLTFSSIGVQNAVSHFVAKANSVIEKKKILYSALIVYVGIASICSCILYFFSDYIALKITGIEKVSYNLKLLSPMLIIGTLESIYTGYFNGNLQMKITARIQLIEQIIKTVVTIGSVEILSKNIHDPEILSVGATIGINVSMFICSIICWYEKIKMPISTTVGGGTENVKIIKIVKEMLKYTVPISIGAIFVGINKNFDSYVIFNLLSPKIGFENSKIFYGILASKVEVLICLPLALNACISIVLIPNVSKLKDTLEKRNLIEKVICLSFGIGSLFAFGYIFYSEEIFKILYSNSGLGSNYLRIVAISLFFSVVNQIFISVLQCYEKNNKVLKGTLYGTSLKILCCFIFLNCNCNFYYITIISNIVFYIFCFSFNYYEVKNSINLELGKKFLKIFILFFITGLLSRYLYVFLVESICK